MPARHMLSRMTTGPRRLLSSFARTRAGRGLVQAIDTRVGVARAVEGFDRPWWLYRAHGVIPRPELKYRPPLPVDDEDVALCERLVDAYSLAVEQEPAQSGMWAQEVFRARQGKLVSPLRDRDARLLAERLAQMFRSDFVLGMAPGSMGLKQTRVRASLGRLLTVAKLVALAESVGSVAAETVEQGDVGVAFSEGGLEGLIARTETALGVRLDLPDIGAAYGPDVDGRLITPDMPDHVYAAARIRDAIRLHLTDGRSPVRLVEIGGGYGGMALWLLKMLDLHYTIVDLPIVNVLQGFFLSHALGASEVSFHGESPKRIAITPTHALSTVEAPFDVLANKDSMPEIPFDAATNYLRWARSNCDGIFYSYNQEAGALVDGVRQNVVPRLVEEVGGFERLRRDAAWLRRGYFEEIYRVVPVNDGARWGLRTAGSSQIADVKRPESPLVTVHHGREAD